MFTLPEKLTKVLLTLKTRIEQMFTQITSEDSLLHNSSPLQLSSGRTVGEKGAQERDELASLPQHCNTKQQHKLIPQELKKLKPGL